MKDLLQEVQELEKLIAREQRTVDVHRKSDAVDEDGCFWSERRVRLDSVEKLIEWLTELLEIKKARLSVEVFMQQDYDLEPDESEPEEDAGMKCGRCGHGPLEERGSRIVCLNCGCSAKWNLDL